MNIQIPSHEKLKEAFCQGEDAVVALFDEFGEQLQKQSNSMQERQVKLSKNSSKPASSDGYDKQNRTTSLRQKRAKN